MENVLLLQSESYSEIWRLGAIVFSPAQHKKNALYEMCVYTVCECDIYTYPVAYPKGKRGTGVMPFEIVMYFCMYKKKIGLITYW